MADIQHGTLATTNLHNPKGMDVNTTSDVVEIDSGESAMLVTVSGTCVGINHRNPANKVHVVDTSSAPVRLDCTVEYSKSTQSKYLPIDVSGSTYYVLLYQ